jgi:hypothetical protein
MTKNVTLSDKNFSLIAKHKEEENEHQSNAFELFLCDMMKSLTVVLRHRPFHFCSLMQRLFVLYEEWNDVFGSQSEF